MTLHHQTLTFERQYKASPRRMFAAFADPRARELGGPDGPGGAVMKLTIQMAAVEPGMLDRAGVGHAATLDNLVLELAEGGWRG